ncbi:TspO/MBR family protein [Amnibacterium setariae]|uniref:Tryptophan-rich sensory protein n=1 Tax=Amnibacterium setariae TaxID=2306585 RepID=A0A3A1U572_9MICO|nr:TspO/MBR family protein [Amnibacterium setariae]RIX30607.1 tryptophan-rich sensory protein [Amnibacterium setariae]
MGPRRDTVRVVVVIVSMVLAIVGSAFGSGAFGGQPIQDASGGALAADSTLLAPGTGAFQIWSVIYLGLAAHAVLQALPSRRTAARHRRIGWLAAASMLLNAAWIISVQLDLLALSVPVIVALLVVLIAIVLRLGPAEGAAERIVTDGTFGLYLGWVTIATVANVTAVLTAAGFTGAGLPADAWAVAVLVVAAAIGVLTAVRDGARTTPALALAWGLAWIAVARSTAAPESTPVAVAAAVAAVVVLLAPLALRLRGVPTRRPLGTA